MNVHSTYLAIITFRGGVTEEKIRELADPRTLYILYGLNHVSHARFQSLSVIFLISNITIVIFLFRDKCDFCML